MPETDWSKALKPLIDKYRKKPHPLDYKNLYQLVVMVVLSAQDSDKHINEVAPPFFKKYRDMKALSKATIEEVMPLLGKVRNFRNKINWLLAIAQQVKADKNIPLTMEELVALPGIGRKSANVIMKGAGVKAEGIIVDLHVVRVAPRLGIASGSDPKKIEQQMMEVLPQKQWGEIGMALSFLGRETCRPTHPGHHMCIVREHCAYFHEHNKIAPAKKKTAKAKA
jgi:endonuclease-3